MDIKLQVLRFALGFVPGAAPFLPIIDQYWPVLEKGLPIAANLISQGAQRVAAFKSAHPDLMDAVKGMASAALNIQGKDVAPEDISDDDAVAIASPLIGEPWTAADQQRWFDKASGNIG